MNTLSKTKELLKKYDLFAKKGYGQNFLVDDVILDNIVEAGNLQHSDTVIEIGPGLGNLTKRLLESAGHVIAFEIDKDMVEILNERFNVKDNFLLVNKDIMEVDLSKYINGKVKVIANLPYYITTPILFKLLEYKEHITDIVIMVQKEVADRLLALPCSKDYGVLTINTNYVADVKRIVNVANTCFIPAPNVTSSVVKLEINLEKSMSLQNEETFKRLVKAAFMARRKKMINSIMNANIFNVSKEELTKMIENIGFDENVRAEEIPPEKYIELSNILSNK